MDRRDCRVKKVIDSQNGLWDGVGESMGLDRSNEEMDEVEEDVVGGRKAEVDFVGDEGAPCFNGSP